MFGLTYVRAGKKHEYGNNTTCLLVHLLSTIAGIHYCQQSKHHHLALIHIAQNLTLKGLVDSIFIMNDNMNKYLCLSISFHLTNATSRSRAHTPVCMGRRGGGDVRNITNKTSESGGWTWHRRQINGHY